MKNVKYFVIAVALLFPFYLAYGQEAKQETREHSPTKEKRAVATLDPDGVQRVEITGGEYYFDPNYIVVKVNVPVEFKVKKAKGYVSHDIVVKAPDAGIDFKVDLSDKETKTVKFTPTKIGKYPMECDKRLLFFKSHKERGMEGVIEVVP
jgi:plastocyanin domain-containing protein